MAGESTQMAAPSPAAFVLPRLVGRPVPGDFIGCRCLKLKCESTNCLCVKELYRCTSNCKCVECDNIYGVRGSDSNTEPGQGGMGLDMNKGSSSNIETEQGGTSSMAGGSTRRVGRPVPEDFNGCKCQHSICDNGKCLCVRGLYRCTLKCKCRHCANRFGLRSNKGTSLNIEPEQAGDTRGSDSNTEPGQGGTGGEAVQTTPSSNIESEQTNDASSMAREPPQMEEQPTQSEDKGGFDLNKLP